MRIVNAEWEQRSLGKRVFEIEFEPADFSQPDFLVDQIEEIKEITRDAEMVVVKTPIAKIDLVHSLEALNFRFMETQLSLRIAIQQELPELPPAFASIARRISYTQVSDQEKLKQILQQIDENMFTTDRIALDPEFGAEIAATRYRSWLKDLHGRENHVLLELVASGRPIGFIQLQENASSLHALLGGVYPRFQGLGLGAGMLTTCVDYGRHASMSNVCTKVSSNNPDILSLYVAFGFQITGIHYVLRKIQLDRTK